MKLEKAIKILEAVTEGGKLITDAEQREASKLGIKAIKLVKEVRNLLPHPHWQKLPGETKD